MKENRLKERMENNKTKSSTAKKKKEIMLSDEENVKGRGNNTTDQ